MKSAITVKSAIDTIEWAAVDRENGFIHLRAGDRPNGHAHGLRPVWNGAGIRHKLIALLAIGGV